MLGEAKAWILGHAVMLLGAALAVVSLYAAYLHFVRVPMVVNAQHAAELQRDQNALLVKDAALTNQKMADAAKICSDSVQELADSGAVTAVDVQKILQQIRGIGKQNKEALAAYRPDPNKTACENATDELTKFKARRGR